MRRYHLVPLLGALITLALVLAGCGGASPKPAQTVRACSGLTDTCHSTSLNRLEQISRLTAPRFSGGCSVVDVSDYQGYLNWATIKPYVCGGITKGGEGSSYAGGGYFVHNWTQMRALGIWHSMYWFVRGYSGCQTQASLIIARLQSVGYAHDPSAGNVDLDMEVPGANDGGMAGCLASRIYAAFHRGSDIYTAPGTWPGGSHAGLPLWQASYGSYLSPYWQPVLAWQCTDGVYGCVHYIGGIGYGDVSINYGIINERGGPPPAPPRIHCYGPRKQDRSAYCNRIYRSVAGRLADQRYVQSVSYFRFGCWRRYPTPKHGQYVRWGPNHRRNFCTRLYRIAAADQAYVKAQVY